MKPIFRISICVLLIYLTTLNSCKKESLIITNQAPIANAGPDQSILLPTDSVHLDGSASKDMNGIIHSFLWTKISGPASFIFSPATTSSVNVNNLVRGIYLFELKVTDSEGLSAIDRVQITVIDPFHINQPPYANAGEDQTIISPKNITTIDGKNSTDPDNDMLHYLWTKISGSSVNIFDPKDIETQVSFLEEGVYQFELKVSDPFGLFSMDTIQINVIAVSCINGSRPRINAQLIPVGTLSQARVGMAIVSAGNKIVFAGASLSAENGNPYYEYGSSVVDIYDLNTQTWSIASLSEQRSDITAIAVGNKIFFAGGRLGDGALDRLYSTIDIYDVSNNTWSIASLSEPRAYIAAATVGNIVFFAGGEKDHNYNTTDKVDMYDLSSNNWATATLSEPRAFISAVTINNKIYFAGGHQDDRWYAAPSNKIDIYDYASNTWSASVLNQPMGFMLGSVLAEKIYWAEGCTVEIKDVNTWNSTITQLSQPLGWRAINEGQNVVVKNNTLVFPFHNDNTFDIYDIVTNTWSIGKLNKKVTGASMISVNNEIYVAGGYEDRLLSNKVFKLEF